MDNLKPLIDLFLFTKSVDSAPTTVERYREALKGFEPHFKNRNVTDSAVQKYINSLKVSVASKNIVLKILKTFFNWAVAEGYMEKNPIESMKPIPEEKHELQILTEPEIAELIATPKEERDSAIILLILDCGLAASEICNLNKSDVDLTGMIVRVGDRRMGFDSTTREALTAYLESRTDENEALFVSQRGERLGHSSIRQMLRRVAEKADMRKDISAQMLRDTFAVSFLKDGGNPIILYKMMGLKSIRMIEERYIDQKENPILERPAKEMEKRDKLLIAFRETGMTCEELAGKFKITEEHVKRIIDKHRPELGYPLFEQNKVEEK